MIREQFLRTIQKFRMIDKGETVFAAVSGGRDSVTLLYLLCELKKARKLKLAILHVNHQLRGKASHQDEAFVKKLAQKFKLPLYSVRAQLKEKLRSRKISLEEAGREARYQFFEHAAKAKRAQKIAVAHTQDDQAETVLMRLITGTGLQGLQAIRPKRKLNGAYLIRPLIEIPRSEIQKFVKANHIQFREDTSNRSLRFLRNRIRLKLIPFIERGFNPQVKKALARLPHLLDVDLSFLDESARIYYQRLADQRNPGEVKFAKKSFLKLKPSIQYRLVNCALTALGGSELDFDHWNTFLETLHSKRHIRLQMPKGLLASISSDSIRMIKLKKTGASFSYPLSLGKTIFIPEIAAALSCRLLKKKYRVIRKANKNFEIFDAEKLSFPLTVRNRKPGDRFQPLGRSEAFKLKKFLINKHIPNARRDRLPLVLSGDTIAWVGAVQMSDAFKVDQKTKRFVKIALAHRNRI